MAALTNRTVPCLCAVGMLSLASLATAADPAPAKLANAAQAKYGALFEARGSAKDVVFDKRTDVDMAFDGNAHSRYVVTGVPYTLTVELAEKVPVEKLSFTHSDYAGEAAPKDIEIRIDGGAPIAITLAEKRPAKGKIEWQDAPLGKPAKRIEVTVKSNYEGTVNYGGMGDIAVWTSADMESAARIPAYDPKSAVFVHLPPMETPAGAKVVLPPVAAPGEHPCVVMTKAEFAQLRKTLDSTERGRETLKTFLGIAGAILEGKVEIPDPKGPGAQLKRSGDVLAARHDRLSMNAGTLGRAYALTGETKYAKHAAAILRGYAAVYSQYAEHKGVNGNDTGKVMSQRLSEAMWLIPMISGYDEIYNSGELTGADKKAIENDLFRACVTFILRKDLNAEAAKRDKASPGWRAAAPAPVRNKAVGNWLNFYAAATLMSGAAIGDTNMVDLAAEDYKRYIQSGIGDDGMWGEGAIGYQLFAIRAMSVGMEAAARQGIDLWGFDNARFKMMFDSPLWYMYPDASAPGINDSARAKIGDWSTMTYDYAFVRYGDPRYASLVNTSPRQLHFSTSIYLPTIVYAPAREPAAVTYPSRVFGNLGFAVLRDKSRYTLLKYGPHGGPHGHPDKLNVILFADDELGGEPRFHGYEDPLYSSWTKQTLAHNTMTVDQRKQTPGQGRLLVFEDAAPLQAMRAEVAGVYPGVLLDRAIVVTPGAVLDLYRGTSSRERTWDRTLRYQGKIEGLVTVAEPATLDSQSGYQNFKIHKTAPADAGWRGAWATKPGKFSVAVAGAPRQIAYVGIGPDEEQMAVLRQTGKVATFAQASSLESWGSPVSSVALVDSGNPDVAAMEVKQGATTTRLFVSYGNAAWKAGAVESDARLLCILETGDEQRVLVAGGAKATVGGVTLAFEAAGNHIALIKAGKATIVSSWSPQKK